MHLYFVLCKCFLKYKTKAVGIWGIFSGWRYLLDQGASNIAITAIFKRHPTEPGRIEKDAFQYMVTFSLRRIYWVYYNIW